MPFPAMLVGTFSAALYTRPRWLAYAAAPLPIVGMVLALTTDYFSGSTKPVDVAILSFLSLGAWTGGWLVRRRARQAELARAAAPELAREAVAAERTRMARELHDIVAHSVSIIAVQAGAAEELLDTGDPAQARPHVQAVRKTAHEALVELRRLVGVLREDEPLYAPQPGLARLDDLVAETRTTGLPVELAEEGVRPAVSAGIQLAAYRIVKESLTNVAATPAPIKVIIADDHELMRGGLRAMLGAQEDIEVVGEASDGGEAVEEALRLHPDVVIMDIRMPRLDGIEATRRLVAHGWPGPVPKVLVLTTFDLDEYVWEALRAGAGGFMLKDVPPRQLAEAVRTVAAGESLLAPAITRRLVERFVRTPPRGGAAQQERFSELTERELEVLALVARGMSNAEIAGQLFVSEATVKTHVGRVLAKLDLRDRVQAVVLAYETGLVEPGEQAS